MSTPPSPVPFVAPTPRSPTWDEYLASSVEFPVYSFPGGFSDSNIEPRETRQGFTYAGGPSPPYSSVGAVQRRPPMKMTPTNQKRKASPLLPPNSFPIMSTMSQSPPPAVTFPLSVLRRGMKTVDMKTVASKSDDAPGGTQVGRWTKREHELFLEGLQRFGKSWKKISSLVHTRTLVQIRTHAQKYLQKQSRAAIKADAKAARDAAALQSQGAKYHPPQQDQPFRQDERCLPQQQPPVATGRHPKLQMDVPRAPTLPPRHWKSPQAGDRSNGFVPLAFPTTLSTSASKPSSTVSPRSAFQINSVSRLDQLLQDDNSSVPVFVDEYYTSPTAIEDDLLRPLYTGEQWVPRLAHPAASANYANKRRRLEVSGPASTSTSTSATVVGPVMRDGFQPLPAPDNLPSSNISPAGYGQRQSAAAAVLLAANETDETTNYPNAWL
ncbi:unnamed protein product [Phytophthora fragariaefolia]|uniref:Unnamed protein product n=1 Tax=Phytophthora fragariaefolia TaxID=1490495 RepID=A0A9W7CU27_9STRA|nr:unnamed protein product [Phytophthora fragariaefolia]